VLYITDRSQRHVTAAEHTLRLLLGLRRTSCDDSQLSSMAKGSSAGKLVPLIIFVLVAAVLAAVGFVAYSIANDVGSQTRKKMEKKNISFTKDGMKVGVKEVTQEQQGDSAQRLEYPPSIPTHG
jgi:hypothetical protein